MDSNLYNLLLHAVDACPDKAFFYYRGSAFSYRDTLATVQQLTAHLRGRGIAAGDRILVNLGNIPEFLYTLLSACQIGAISVLTNPATRRIEMQHYIEETSPSLIVTHSESLTNFITGEDLILPRERFILIDDPSRETGFAAAISTNHRYSPHESLAADHPAAIIFTSAMDGYALGAMITHGAIWETARVSQEIMINHDDLFITALPLFHSFGLTSSLFNPLYSHSSLYILDKFSPRSLIDLFKRLPVTFFCGVPFMYFILAKVIPEGTVFPQMRAWISGGEAISSRMQEYLKNSFNIDVRQGYGLTEASPIVTWNLISEPNVYGSIGKPMPYNQVRLKSEEHDSRGDPAEGELMVKGINVIPGYYNRPEQTAALIRDGWLYSGDLARRDMNGYYYITGRKKSMFLRKGFNVYPREVERILCRHPFVLNAASSITLEAREDGSFEEGFSITIVKKPGYPLDSDDLSNWCKDNLSSYKIPDTFVIK